MPPGEPLPGGVTSSWDGNGVQEGLCSRPGCEVGPLKPAPPLQPAPALLLRERVQWAGFPLREENGIRRRGSPWPSNRLLVFVYWATRQVCLSPPSPFSLCLPVSRPGGNEGDWRISSCRAGGRSCGRQLLCGPAKGSVGPVPLFT